MIVGIGSEKESEADLEDCNKDKIELLLEVSPHLNVLM